MVQELFTQLVGPLGLLTVAFWMWMIYDCVQHEHNRDRNTWLWLLIILNFPGAIVYFIARWLPRAALPTPNFFRRWAYRDRLWQAEAAAMNIGKAHQFVTLGNILFDIGELDRATTAYQQALDKEPKNPQALWGAGNLAIATQNFAAAQDHLKSLLQVDPEHKYGDASLAYGRVLYELQDWEATQAHLEKHLRNWGTPEAYILLAQVSEKQGNLQKAREYLETMIIKVKGAPPYHYRRNRHFVDQAQKMLKTLGR